jgi:hypothetical protein
MKHRRVIFGGLVLLFCAALSVPTGAFLGLGDLVFDPSVYGQAVQQVIRLEQQYAQLVQSYQMLRNQYEQLVWNARRVPVNMSARYRAVRTPWRFSTAANTYGTTAGWSSAINSGQAVAAGYAESTESLEPYGSALANVPADQRGHFKTGYGTVELIDGATQGAIETIGRLRANAGAVQHAIQGLEDDSLSSDPELNTEVAVLNKMNAAHLIAVRTAQDANQLLVALAEQQAIAAKRTRDAEARAINQHIRFMTDGKAVLVAQAAGASDAMLAFRFP